MSAQPMRVSPVVQSSMTQDDLVVLGFLRDAMKETGWTFDALCSVLDLPDRQYVGKILEGEKPINLKRLVALPDDLERQFLKKWAEHKGLIVVAPVSEQEAKRFLAVGLYSLLASRTVM